MDSRQLEHVIAGVVGYGNFEKATFLNGDFSKSELRDANEEAEREEKVQEEEKRRRKRTKKEKEEEKEERE